jgi:hypothetical protein
MTGNVQRSNPAIRNSQSAIRNGVGLLSADCYLRKRQGLA